MNEHQFIFLCRLVIEKHKGKVVDDVFDCLFMIKSYLIDNFTTAYRDNYGSIYMTNDQYYSFVRFRGGICYPNTHGENPIVITNEEGFAEFFKITLEDIV